MTRLAPVLRWLNAHRDQLAIALVAGTALLLRAAILFRLPVLYVVGSRPYYATALQLVTGQDPTALSLRHTPGYPAFLVAVIGLFGVDPQAIALVQHLIGVLSALLAYGTVRLVLGYWPALLGGLAVGLNSTLVVYEHHILTEPLFIFLVLLAVFLLVAALQRRRGWLLFAAGLVAGLAALTRPIGQTILLAAPAILWLRTLSLRSTVMGTLLVGAGFLATAGPWAVRNALVYEEPGVRHPGSTLLGRVMHERPYTKGFFTLDGATDPDPLRQRAREIIERMSPDEPDPLEMWQELQDRLDISPARASQLMGEIAIDTIRRHPLYYARVFALRVWNLFTLPRDEPLMVYATRARGEWPGRLLSPAIKSGTVPDLDPSRFTVAHEWEFERAQALADLFKPTRYAPLLAALFVLGTAGALLRPDRRALLAPALVALGMIVINGVIAGDKPRYRYPLDPLITIVATGGIVLIADAMAGAARRLRGRSPRPLDMVSQRASGAKEISV